MPKITILTVTHSREKVLKKYLDSLIRAERFKEIDIVILINGEDSKTERLLNQYRREYKSIRFLKSKNKSRGESRNLLIQHAKGEILYFLDDDVFVGKKAFSVLLDSFRRYRQIDIFGGPSLTPQDNNLFQKCQGYVLGSFFGTLWTSQRYRKSGVERITNEHALILCNLAIRKKVFDESGIFFNTRIVCAEENLLLQNLILLGYRAMFTPELIVYHERRRSYLGFCKQIFTYGNGRRQIMKYAFCIDNLFCLIPGIFAIYMILLLFCRCFVFKIPFYAYLSLCFLSSLSVMFKTKKLRAFWISFILFPTMHFVYTLGLFFGLAENGFIKPDLSCREE